MKAVWGSNRSSKLRHLPLIIIHNYPWYIPPSTGITQPKSSIHLVNDREWAERWRAEFEFECSTYTHNYSSSGALSVTAHRKKTHSGSTACVPGLWMGSDCLSQWDVTVKVTFRRWTTADRDGICTLHLTIKVKKERMWSSLRNALATNKHRCIFPTTVMKNTLNIIFRRFLPQHSRELHNHKPDSNFYHLHV